MAVNAEIVDSKRRGFTLLELLTVMAIMIVLMGIAASSMIGLSRGASMRASVSNLRATLSLARQTAMTQRCRTQVIFWKGNGLSHYVVCMEGGSNIGGGNNEWLKIATPKWENLSIRGSEMYNLTTEQWGEVETNYPDSLRALTGAAVPVEWQVGDRYGWLLGSQMHLPEGIAYTNGTKQGGAPSTIVFNPDGTTPINGSGTYDVEITEEAIGSAMVKKVRVQALTGRITVQ